MTQEESRKLADEMFDELEAALVPKGWVPGRKGLYHRCNRELHWSTSEVNAMAGVQVLTNSGHGDGSCIPSIQVKKWVSERHSWEGSDVEEAVKQVLVLGLAKEEGEVR